MKQLLYLFLIILLVACQSKPKGILSNEQMKDLLYDYHIAQAMCVSLSDYDGDSIIQAVFDKHNISQADFDSSIVYYAAHADEFKQIYLDLKDRFTDENEKLRLALGNTERTSFAYEDADTANLWNAENIILLRSIEGLNVKAFSIKADSSFHQTDSYILVAKMHQFTSYASKKDMAINASIYVKTDSNNVFASSSRAAYDGKLHIEIHPEAKENIATIGGFIYFSAPAEAKALCIVDDIRLIRLRNKAEDETEESTIEENDTIVANSLVVDSIEQDSTIDQHVILSPEQRRQQMLEKNASKKTNIKKAPEKRTPNSIGIRKKQ